jgi:hypothetical protein
MLYFNKEIQNSLTSYKLARKEVYVSTANLASLFQRMFEEPKSKQLYIQELHQFTVLNHLLSSYIATLSLYNKEHNFTVSNVDELKPVSMNTIYLLDLVLNNLNTHNNELSNVPLIRRKMNVDFINQETMIAEQFDLIQKVAYDIFKLSEKLKI